MVCGGVGSHCLGSSTLMSLLCCMLWPLLMPALALPILDIVIRFSVFVPHYVLWLSVVLYIVML